jgi:hypothetical protein
MGRAATIVLEILKEYERQIYELARASLGEDAQKRLTEKVTAWLESAYVPGMALHTRYSGLSAEVAKKPDASQSEKSNLLGALMLDPLAGLDPTVREIAQTRLFAERAMFVAQRMPKVLRMEIELVSFRFIETPEVKAGRVVYRGRLEPETLAAAMRSNLEADGWKPVGITTSGRSGSTQVYDKGGTSLQVRIWEGGPFSWYTYLELAAIEMTGPRSGLAPASGSSLSPSAAPRPSISVVPDSPAPVITR